MKRFAHRVLLVVLVFASGAVGITHSRGASGTYCLIARPDPRVTAGDTAIVQFCIPSTPSVKDWIGLYTSSASPNNAFIAWRYTGNTRAGSFISITVPLNATPGPGYEWRLFSNDTYDQFSPTYNAHSTVVAPQAALSATTPASPGTSVGLTWSGIPNPHPHDWVGLYQSTGAPDGSFVAWQYTDSDAGDGAMNFLLPGTDFVGTYQLRLFANDSFVRMGAANVSVG